jgi:hypothetical protein
MHTHRLTFRKDIKVPTAGSGDVHVATRVYDTPDTMVCMASLIAPAANGGTLYLGWYGTNATPDHVAGIELTAGDDATWVSPKKGADGNPEPFDLYDLWLAGDTNGDALLVVTW